MPAVFTTRTTSCRIFFKTFSLIVNQPPLARHFPGGRSSGKSFIADTLSRTAPGNITCPEDVYEADRAARAAAQTALKEITA